MPVIVANNVYERKLDDVVNNSVAYVFEKKLMYSWHSIVITGNSIKWMFDMFDMINILESFFTCSVSSAVKSI